MRAEYLFTSHLFPHSKNDSLSSMTWEYPKVCYAPLGQSDFGALVLFSPLAFLFLFVSTLSQNWCFVQIIAAVEIKTKLMLSCLALCPRCAIWFYLLNGYVWYLVLQNLLKGEEYAAPRTGHGYPWSTSTSYPWPLNIRDQSSRQARAKDLQIGVALTLAPHQKAPKVGEKSPTHLTVPFRTLLLGVP